MSLKLILKKIYSFLSARGIVFDTNLPIFTSEFFFNRFSILGWQFLNLEKNFYVGVVSRTNIRDYKIKLKAIIKNYGNCETFVLLELINRVIFEWSCRYNCSDFSWDIWGELDVYLDKLLWKWARRRHPRRPNTWIYLKYWKPFFGSWKFFTIDINTSKLHVLRSHSLINTLVYRLPLSLHVYDLFNVEKINSIFYKKFIYLFQGVFKLLWQKQKGLCFCCRRIFFTVNFGNVKVCRLRNSQNFLSTLILLHSYCFI